MTVPGGQDIPADESADESADEQETSARDEPETALSLRAEARARGVLALPGRISRGAGRIPLLWRVVSLVVLVLLVAGSGAWDASLASQESQTRNTQSAENAAAAAATTDIEQILSYDYRDLSADLSRAIGDTTGEFNGQFTVLASQLITPTATQQHTITTATVPDVSVISATGNQVVVLVFVDQSTTDKTQTKAQKNVSQLKVTMENVGGRWLVEQFQAL